MGGRTIGGSFTVEVEVLGFADGALVGFGFGVDVGFAVGNGAGLGDEVGVSWVSLTTGRGANPGIGVAGARGSSLGRSVAGVGVGPRSSTPMASTVRIAAMAASVRIAVDPGRRRDGRDGAAGTIATGTSDRTGGWRIGSVVAGLGAIDVRACAAPRDAAGGMITT